MPRTVLDVAAHDQAVLNALAPIGRPIYYTQAPDAAVTGVADRTGPDYVVVYPLVGGSRDGEADDPDEDAVLAYQLTCVARSAQGARWLVGRIEQHLPAITVPGRRVMRVEPITSGGVRPDPDDDRLVIATPVWHLHSTPAT